MRRKKQAKSTPWWVQVAAEVVVQEFGEMLDELPPHELNSIMMAACDAAATNDRIIVGVAVSDAFMRTRAEALEVRKPRRRKWNEDRSERFADDQRLRAAGWVLVARPQGGEPLWRHGRGEAMTQGEALRVVDCH